MNGSCDFAPSPPFLSPHPHPYSWPRIYETVYWLAKATVQLRSSPSLLASRDRGPRQCLPRDKLGVKQVWYHQWARQVAVAKSCALTESCSGNISQTTVCVLFSLEELKRSRSVLSGYFRSCSSSFSSVSVVVFQVVVVCLCRSCCFCCCCCCRSPSFFVCLAYLFLLFFLFFFSLFFLFSSSFQTSCFLLFHHFLLLFFRNDW